MCVHTRIHTYIHTYIHRYGFVPEAFDITADAPKEGLTQYPLRPELAESAFYLYRATRNDEYRFAGKVCMCVCMYVCTDVCTFGCMYMRRVLLV